LGRSKETLVVGRFQGTQRGEVEGKKMLFQKGAVKKKERGLGKGQVETKSNFGPDPRGSGKR